ncbi:MAG TPA: aminotransferase class I/II-fold pyridoxal phosphate-dependent enzyme, partial [Actinomycetota bacterium]|nr:aminotransferase class I/II-fold pyridoxal phosphate-dependent enzyme [Actinomycetota bacterium]
MRALAAGIAQPAGVATLAPDGAALRVARCQQALLGEDGAGRKVHPGMFDEGVISFAHGEGMRRPHPSVVAAGVRALLDTADSALDGYLFLHRLEPLDEAIARFFVADGIDPATAGNVCVDSGTTRLFLAFLHAVADPGDTFLVAPTYYYPLASWCELAGVRLACVPTRRCNDYKLTREDLDAWYDRSGPAGGLRGLFLFNPTQTGGIYSRQDLDGIAGFVVDHDLVALEDCIFTLTEYDPHETRHHLASCAGMAGRVVTISGGSKAHGLANIRIGWGCGPRPVVEAMNAFTV